MDAGFDTVHNYYEQAVFRQVMESATRYPQIAADLEMLADIACMALNRLPARYIRNQVDMLFYMSKEDRAKLDSSVSGAVEFSFRFMQARAATAASR
jgi:Late competence development protein ComFB